MENVDCDVLVLGSGAAGLRAAISARETGLDVLVLSKSATGKSACTGLAGGVMRGSDSSGAPAHLELTLQAGRGINQPGLAEILSQEAPARLGELMKWGLKAEVRLGCMFAQGRPPIMGEEIVRCLIRKNRELGTRFMENLTPTGLVIENGVAGLTAFERKSGEQIAFSSGAVVLATGGAAALFFRHNNPKRMLGDGWTLAIEAGAILQDIEFVQFYPVCLAEPGHAPLVIPPILADNGILVNERGEDILMKYGIVERPAAMIARDRLSQALFQEIYRNGQKIFLDLRGVTEEQWQSDPFSAILRYVLGDRVGGVRRPLRIAPAAHHTMGGVKIDGRGATSVPGLFGTGEVTGGLHGANRAGGNALSETVVFGAIAGNSAAEWVKGSDTKERRSVLRRVDERFRAQRSIPYAETDLMERIRRIMWEDGGIVRNEAGLSRASENVREILGGFSFSGPGSEKTLTPAQADAIELRSAARVASLILEAAIRRTESRGSHFREDYPEQNDRQWLGHLQVKTSPDGGVWEFVPQTEAGSEIRQTRTVR
ncbi:MAG: FAD-binding protein [Syntrophobacteraceae bacterium]